MLWVLKRTISMRRSFEHPKHMFRLMGKEMNAILGAVLRLNLYVAGSHEQIIVDDNENEDLL